MKEQNLSWSEARDGALDRLVREIELFEFYGFREQLLDVCAQVLTLGRGRTLVFVGRSCENLYDLLDGIFKHTKGAPERILMPFSCRVAEPDAITDHVDLEDFGRHLHDLGLDPKSILAREAGVAFVDCVAWGTTLGNLELLLTRVAGRRSQIGEKTHFIGLTQASIGWTHWRHDRRSQGQRLFEQGRASVAPISTRLWNHLTSCSSAMDSYDHEHWHAPPRLPTLEQHHTYALHLAAELRAWGQRRDVRRAFAGKLSQRAATVPESPRMRALVARLLKSTQRQRGGYSCMGW